MTPQKLNAFSHGVRIQRKAVGMTHRELWEFVKREGGPVAFSTFTAAELHGGGYRMYCRYPKAMGAVVRKLGVSASLLIRMGQWEIDTHGCRHCTGRINLDCRHG